MTARSSPDERKLDAPRDRFEDEWPGLRKGLDRVLASRGVPFDKREDLLQETGLRLYHGWEAVDPSVPVFKLAVTIALNLMRDEFRRRRREVICDLPDKASPVDVERAGLARVEFGGVTHAMTKLSRDHRAVLLQDLSEEEAFGDRSQDAVKMLRLRARRRLAAIVQAASAWLLWPWLRFNRSTGDQLSASTAAALVLVVSAMAIGRPGISSANQRPRAAQVTIPSTASNLPSKPPDRGESQTVRPSQTMGGIPAPPEDVGEVSEPDPVRVEAGGASVEAKATVEADGIRVEVRDTGGPVPVCIDGGPDQPNPLECPEKPNGADAS